MMPAAMGSILRPTAPGALLALVIMAVAPAPGRTDEPADARGSAAQVGMTELAARSAPRCRRRCAQRQRVCHTERRCSYATNRCRNVRICRSQCTYWETYPSNCTP